MKKNLYIVDGSSYIYRAFHAMPPLTTSSGRPTGAIKGVSNMMMNLRNENDGSSIITVFDAKGKTFRSDIYSDYKANRYLKNRKFNTLSGGEQRRVHFARSLLQLWRESNSLDPCYLMLDEPTSNLDLFHQIKMMNTIKKLSIEGVGIFMILHDLNLAFKYSDYIAILKNGKIVSFGEPMSIINDDILSNTFDVKIQVNKKDDNIFINYV